MHEDVDHQMRILMFFPSRIDYLPPLLTAAASMSKLGAKVLVVASDSSWDSAEYLRRHCVEVCLERDGDHPKTYCGRAMLRARVGIALVRRIHSFQPDCLWYHGEYAMEYSFIPGVNGRAVIVAHAHELCDCDYFLRKVLDATLRRADLVVVPEVNRLWMLRMRSRSRARFFEIPNRPLGDASSKMDEPCTKEVFRKNGGPEECNRFLIYQGAFMEGRCLREILYAFRGIKDEDVGLILLGGGFAGDLTGELKGLAKEDPRIAVVPRFPPPNHLPITAGCVGGILLYSPSELNNIYCAPNKIYEYAAMGLGMILPDYPGVSLLNRIYGLGELCDPEDVQSIRTAMLRVLMNNQEHYRSAAARFLESTPKPEELYKEVYEEVLERIDQRRRGGARARNRKA
jgi:glycosyltransferase involved in cell wall biosynthesis